MIDTISQCALQQGLFFLICILSVLVSMSADVVDDKHSTTTRTEIRCLIGCVESYLVHEVIMVMLTGID